MSDTAFWEGSAGLSAFTPHRTAARVASSRRSGGLEPEEADHRLEIAVVVQQGVPALDAESADDQIDSLADRYPPGAQRAVIGGRLDGQIGIEQRDDGEAPQSAFDKPCLAIRAQSLQHLAQDQIPDQQRLHRYQCA